MKRHWKTEWNKWSEPKPKAWSPKVNDPRQADMFDYLGHKALREGFARLDEAIKQVTQDGE